MAWVFISGLRQPLYDILFSVQVADLPTALALALEVEANHELCVFGATFANRNKKRKTQQTNKFTV